jgi:3-hydroxyisobutyrate dehydrogenase
MAVVAWIGLGQMGRPMAARLVAAGHTVRGVEPQPAAADAAQRCGVQVCDSVMDAVTGADVVFTMLPEGRQVEKVLTGRDGVFAVVTPDVIVVDCSTIDIATCRHLHAAAEDRQLACLDAPVSGGVNGAAAGSLTIMVGGEESLFVRARPLLEHMGHYVVHLGPAAAGQAAKIVNNMIFGVCLATTCEGITLARRLGLDAAALYEVVTRSSGDNWVLRTWYPAPGVVPSAPSSNHYAPGFTTSLLVKDLGLALAAGEAAGVPLAAASAAHRLFARAAADGAERLDCTSLILSIEKTVADAAVLTEVAQ